MKSEEQFSGDFVEEGYVFFPVVKYVPGKRLYDAIRVEDPHIHLLPENNFCFLKH